MDFARNKLVPFSLLVLVVCLLINIKPASSQSTKQLIEKICRSQEDYGFCRKTFLAHLKSPNADIVDLTQITIEVASDQATKTQQFIRDTLDKTEDPALKNALSECENAYGILMRAFGDAAVSFFQKDYNGVENSEHIAPRAENSCEVTLATPPVKRTHIMDERNREMRIFIAMSTVAVQELLGRPANIAPASAPV